MLFKKKKIKNLVFNNRIVVSPMCQYSAYKGSPSKWHYKHLGNLIKSGAGSLVVESTSISNSGRISKKDLCLFNKEHLNSHKKLIHYLKKINNIPIILQISHAGRKGSTHIPWVKKNTPLSNYSGWQTFAPSSIERDKGWPIPKKLNIPQIHSIINEFKNTARLAFKAGYDGVEIHMAHGYLLHQFFSPISNKRNDLYGGTLKNRIKIHLQIIKKINQITPKNKIIGVRVTGKDHLNNGIKEKDCIHLINKLKKIGLNYACISSGGIIPITNMNFKKGFRVKMAERIKKKTNIIIRSSGEIFPISFMNKVLKKKSLDFIAIGRKFISKKNFIYNDDSKPSYGKKPKQYWGCF